MVGSGGHRRFPGEETRQNALLVEYRHDHGQDRVTLPIARYLPPRGLPTVSTVRKEGDPSIPSAGVILTWRSVRSDATLGTLWCPGTRS